MKKNEKELLSNLKNGETAKILRLNIKEKETKRHLLDMGLTQGTEVKIKKIAPMGDPIDIELRGYELCMRKEELDQIEVIRITKKDSM